MLKKKGVRICASLAAVCAILPATALTTGARLAPILPEIERHIAEAHAALDRGDYSGAQAHAAAVLLGDELTYEVNFVSTSDNDRPTCRKALGAAFAIWEKELGGGIKFREVTHADSPQISIVFKPSVRMGQEQVAGFTSWQRKIEIDGPHASEMTFHADMQLRDRDLEFRPMSFEAMRHEACHETGHVLGLDDSDRRGDLMGPLEITHPVSGPTSIEADSVRSLREEAKDIETQAEKLVAEKK